MLRVAAASSRLFRPSALTLRFSSRQLPQDGLALKDFSKKTIAHPEDRIPSATPYAPVPEDFLAGKKVLIETYGCQVRQSLREKSKLPLAPIPRLLS